MMASKDDQKSTLPPNIEKQLKIKVNSCKRLLKDYISYQQEKKDNETKLNIALTSGDDKFSIKQLQELVNESVGVCISVHKSLVQNSTDLNTLYLTHKLDISEGMSKDIDEVLNNVKLTI